MRGWDGVEVNVNDPVQLTHRRHRCRRQLFEIELAVAHVPSKVNGAQITYRGFILGAYISRALTCLANNSFDSASTYAVSNASPNRSVKCGTTLGSNNDHIPSSSTRRMNRSGIQLEIFRLWVRRASSPVLSRSSRNSSRSACQVSRYTQHAPLRLPP